MIRQKISSLVAVTSAAQPPFQSLLLLDVRLERSAIVCRTLPRGSGGKVWRVGGQFLDGASGLRQRFNPDEIESPSPAVAGPGHQSPRNRERQG